MSTSFTNDQGNGYVQADGIRNMPVYFPLTTSYTGSTAGQLPLASTFTVIISNANTGGGVVLPNITTENLGVTYTVVNLDSGATNKDLLVWPEASDGIVFASGLAQNYPLVITNGTVATVAGANPWSVQATFTAVSDGLIYNGPGAWIVTVSPIPPSLY